MAQERLYQFIAISVVAHLILWATMLSLKPVPIQTNTPIDIRYVTQEDPALKTRGQRVTALENEQLEKAVTKLNDQVERLSMNTKRVREETVATRTAEKTVNRAYRHGTPNPSSEESQNQTQVDRHKITIPKPNDAAGTIPVVDASIDRPMGSGATGAGRNVQLSDSTIADYVPGVKQGRFTSLNTNQFENYTFYARINEQIRNRWIQNIRTFLSNVSPSGLDRLATKDQVTEVEVLLDKDGNFQDIIFNRKADHQDLDVAAGAAMELAAPFLNPPSDIVEKDGYIHLRYAFVVLFSPQYFAQPQR